MPVAALIREEIEIPANVNVEINGNTVAVKSGAKELKRDLMYPGIEMNVKDGKVVIECTFPSVITSYSIHYTKLYEMYTQ